jgi:hypothetical protein
MLDVGGQRRRIREVEHAHALAPFAQGPHEVPADEAAAAGDEHRRIGWYRSGHDGRAAPRRSRAIRSAGSTTSDAISTKRMARPSSMPML